MRVRTASILLMCSMALLLYQSKEPAAAEQDAQKAPSSGLSDERINEILVAIAKFDPKLKVIAASDFLIESGDLTIKVKADKPIFYDGKPYQSGAPQTGLYGQAEVSQSFYGIELLLHYLLLRDGATYGGASIEERLTILHEDTPRSKSWRPRTFASKPLGVGQDGTFQDRQVFGHFDTPLPDKTTQILRQELILNSELVATIYIVRTPKEIRVIGYSVPPLISGLVLNGLLANPTYSSLTTTKNLNLDFLFTHLPHAGTAIYIGYNSNLENLIPGLCNTAPGSTACVPSGSGLVRSNSFINDGRQLFVRLSYLFRR